MMYPRFLHLTLISAHTAILICSFFSGFFYLSFLPGTLTVSPLAASFCVGWLASDLRRAKKIVNVSSVRLGNFWDFGRSALAYKH